MALKWEIFATNALINRIQNLTNAPILVSVPNALLKLKDYALKKINKLKTKIQTIAMLELISIKIIKHAWPVLQAVWPALTVTLVEYVSLSLLMTHNLKNAFKYVEMAKNMSYSAMMEIMSMEMDVQEIVEFN